MSIFKVFAKILGSIIVVFSTITLVGLFIGMFTFGSTSFIHAPWQKYVEAVNYTDIPLWIFGVLAFLAIGIPLFFFFILGLKLLVTNLKSLGSVVKYSLLAVWIFAVGALIVIGIQQSTERAYDGKIVKKENILLQPTDTLKIKFVYNDFFSKNIYESDDFRFEQDSTKHEVIYSNNVTFQLKSTDKLTPYIQIEKLAEGKSFKEANERAEKIKYGFKIIGNQLILDNYLLTEMSSKYRNQNVEIYLYLPEGTIFKADESVQHFDRSDNEFFNLHFSGKDYVYKVEDSQVKCLNCPADENEYNDVESNDIETNVTGNDSVTTTTVKVNGEKVIVNETTKPAKTGRLTTDENGKIIKN